VLCNPYHLCISKIISAEYLTNGMNIIPLLLQAIRKNHLALVGIADIDDDIDKENTDA